MKKLLILGLCIALNPCAVNSMDDELLQPEKVITPSIEFSSQKPESVEAEGKIISDKTLDKISKQIEKLKILQQETAKIDPTVRDILASRYEQYIKDFTALSEEISSNSSKFTNEMITERIYQIHQRNNLYSSSYY